MITINNKGIEVVDNNINELITYYNSGGRELAIKLLESYPELLSKKDSHMKKVLYRHNIFYKSEYGFFLNNEYKKSDMIDSIVIFSGKDWEKSLKSFSEYADDSIQEFVNEIFNQNLETSIFYTYGIDDFNTNSASVRFTSSWNKFKYMAIGYKDNITNDQNHILLLHEIYIDNLVDDDNVVDVSINTLNYIIKDKDLFYKYIHKLLLTKPQFIKDEILMDLIRHEIINESNFIDYFFDDSFINRKKRYFDHKINYNLLLRKSRELGFKNNLLIFDFNDLSKISNYNYYDYILIDESAYDCSKKDLNKWVNVLKNSNCTFLIEDDELLDFDINRETIDPDILKDDDSYLVFNRYSGDCQNFVLLTKKSKKIDP